MKLYATLLKLSVLSFFIFIYHTSFSQADDPCSATTLTLSSSCTFSTYTNASATASEVADPSIPAPGCASYSGGDVWFQVTVPASGSVTFDSQSGVITDGGMAVYSGTCTSLSLITCNDDGGAGLMPLIVLTGQTPGATLWVRFWEYGNNNNGTFDFCAYEQATVPAPTNDDCSNAIPLTVNPDNLCGSTTSGTIEGATTSTQTNGCSGTADDDVWYSFVATGTTHTVDLLNAAGSTTDLYHSVYAGSCGSPGTELVCSDPNSSTITGLTPGNTYFVRVFTWSSTGGQTTTFDICIGSPPPPPSNDECTGAISVAVTPPTGTCSPTTGSIASATTSSQTSGCSSGTANDDVWYSFVATSTAVQIDLSNVTGSTTDLYHSVYAGSCGSPGTELVCSDPNTSNVTGLTIGNTYFIRIYSWSSSTGQTTVFDLCISETTPCGTPANQDYCMAPAILTSGPGSFSSNTSGTYTSDEPANLSSLFCGTIENNSWYQFVASSSTETFNFSSVTNCSSGIQAEVYDVTTDADGCCTNFTSVSNCWNPATATSGIVTATGLTVGNTYVLMVDGYGGDVCDFTVINWTAIGILPVSLQKFEGIATSQNNQLSWTTLTETNNDYFNILRSFDGVNFEKIGEVNGAGNSLSKIRYHFTDDDIQNEITFYQLEQVDFDGTKNRSEIISISRKNIVSDLFISPNPVKDVLFVQVQGNKNRIEIINVNGQLMYQADYYNESSFTIPTNDLKNGVYFIRSINEDNTVTIKKFIKL